VKDGARTAVAALAANTFTLTISWQLGLRTMSVPPRVGLTTKVVLPLLPVVLVKVLPPGSDTRTCVPVTAAPLRVTDTMIVSCWPARTL
jgi:hypothetical protein